jgi:Conserved hypothetical protein (DUF2461)
VVDPEARTELVDAVESIEKAGYSTDGETYKRVPSGYHAGDAFAGRFLRHSALLVHHDEPADLALDPSRLLATLGRHWRVLAPLHRWLVAHVQQP